MSEITEILDYRLPARLAELNTFIALASALEARDPNGLELKIDTDTYSISSARLLLDVVADGAVVIARTLLQFLGISYSAATAKLGDMSWKGDDVSIKTLNLPSVTPAAAIAGWPEAPQRAEDLLILCFKTGNKVSAHFTTRNASAQGASISELREAFDLVMRLVNRSVYQPSGRNDVDFTPGGNHGHIVLKTDTTTEYGEI
ncbi:hypothetical protein [Rhizobium leguminosarum]|uniref:hypothetical protein n=1 Tax=Rhizobium leguminosarum TaxID=384 RepID=UPI003F9C65D0